MTYRAVPGDVPHVDMPLSRKQEQLMQEMFRAFPAPANRPDYKAVGDVPVYGPHR